jgi:hypothetical protein
LGTSAGKSRFRFSLLGLLGLITFTCILFAILRQLAGGGEMVWFAVYGVGVLVLSLVVSLWFSYRLNRGTWEGSSTRPKTIRDLSVPRSSTHSRKAESPSA